MDEQPDDADWAELVRRFAAAHRAPSGRRLEMLAAPAGVLGVIALTEACVPDAGVAAAGGYLLLLLGFVPSLVWLGSALILVSLSAIAKLWAPDVVSASVILLVACALYGIAHRLSRAATPPAHATEPHVERAFLLLPFVLSMLLPGAGRAR